MAVTIRTYSGFSAWLYKSLARASDTGITGSVDDFVALAEDKLNRRLLSLREQWVVDTTLTLAASARTISLASLTDFWVERDLYLTTDGGDEKRIIPSVPGQMGGSAISGRPSQWAIRGTVIELNRPADQAHTFRFYYSQRFSLAGGDAGGTNYLLTNHADVYQLACLLEVATHLTDDRAMKIYGDALAERLDELETFEARAAGRSEIIHDRALYPGGGFNIETGGFDS